MVPLDEEAPKAIEPVSLHIDVAGIVLLVRGVHLARGTASGKDNQTQNQYYVQIFLHVKARIERN